MPKVRILRHAASRGKRPPEGWELIEPTLEELEQKMKEAETDSHEGKRKVEALWPIFKIHHQRSRYIFDLYYKRRAISRGEHRNDLFEVLKAGSGSSYGGRSVGLATARSWVRIPVVPPTV